MTNHQCENCGYEMMSVTYYTAFRSDTGCPCCNGSLDDFVKVEAGYDYFEDDYFEDDYIEDDYIEDDDDESDT